MGLTVREYKFVTGFETVTISTTAVSATRVCNGSFGTPNDIVAGTGIVFDGNGNTEIQYIQGSGGAVNISANPQISAGTNDCDELKLIGASDANTVQIDDGDGVVLVGFLPPLGAGDSISFVWDDDNSLWREVSRNV